MIGYVVDRRRSLAIGAILVTAVLQVALASAGEPVTAENAWIPWAPPAIKVHAGYMTVVNRSDVDQVIVGAHSPAYERVELHQSTVKDGLSQMRAVDEVVVPAHGRVAFEPAGLHLMLIGAKRASVVDGPVPIVLRLRGVEQVAVTAVIRRRDGGPSSGHHHHGASH
jgi:copper(I)-binding protein